MSHLILKQLVSCGESRPGSPNPPFHLGPGSLGLSVTKKALSHSAIQMSVTQSGSKPPSMMKMR